MKSYKDISENIFERRDEYLKEQNIRKQRIKKITVTVSAVFAVALTGLGVWKSGVLNSAVSLDSYELKNSKSNESIYENSSIPENNAVEESVEKSEKNHEEKDESADSSKNTKKKDNGSEKEKEKQNTSDIIYNSDDEESYGMPCVHSPEIGSYVLDYPVQVMLNKYGSSKKYAVSVSMVKEGFTAVTDEEKDGEYKRLKDAGCDVKKYTVPYYTGAEAKKEYMVVIGIICTKQQLETLFTGREYGYFIQFFATDDSSKQPNVVTPDDFYEKTTSGGYVREYN